MKRTFRSLFLGFAIIVAFSTFQLQPVLAETASEIDRKTDAALEKLFTNSAAAKELAEIAKAILVFPEVVKAGMLVGGQYGVGALREQGKTVGYYLNFAPSSYY